MTAKSVLKALLARVANLGIQLRRHACPDAHTDLPYTLGRSEEDFRDVLACLQCLDEMFICQTAELYFATIST